MRFSVRLPGRASGGASTTRKRVPSRTVGPTWSSAAGQKIGDTSRIGVFGFCARIVSRKPCSAGTNTRSFIESAFTTLMPTLALIQSASSAAIVRATNGSRWHWPASPSERRSTPARRAATAGHTPSGVAASRQWLIELP